MRYFATAIRAVEGNNPNPGLASTIMKRPEFEVAFDNVGAAVKMVENKEIAFGFDDYLSSIANKDSRELTRIYKDFYKSFNSKKLITQYVDDIYAQTGKFTAFEEAQKFIQEKTYSELLAKLDAFTVENSQGLYRSFDEYINLVNSLDTLTDGSPGISGLLKTVTNLETQLNILYSEDIYKQISQVVGETTENLQAISKVKDDLKLAHLQDGAELQKKLQALVDAHADLDVLGARNNIPVFKKFIKDSRETLKKLIPNEDPKIFDAKTNKEIAEWELTRTKEYKAYQKAKKLSNDVPMFNSKGIDDKIKTLRQSILNNKAAYDTNVKLSSDMREVKLALSDAYKKLKSSKKLMQEIQATEKALREFDPKVPKIGSFGEAMLQGTKIDPSDAINKLTALRDKFNGMLTQRDLPPGQARVLEKSNIFIKKAITRITNGAAEANATISSKGFTDIGSYGKEYTNSIVVVLRQLELLASKLQGSGNAGAKLQTLSDNLYTKNIKKFTNEMLESLEKKFAGATGDVVTDRIKQTFYEGKTFKKETYATFLEDFEETLKYLNEDAIDGLGKLQSDSATFADMSYEVAVSVQHMNETLGEMWHDFALVSSGQKKMLNVSIIEDMLEELHNTKYHLNRTVKTLEGKTPTGRLTDEIGKVFGAEYKGNPTIGQKQYINALNDLANKESPANIDRVMFGPGELSRLPRAEKVFEYMQERELFLNPANIKVDENGIEYVVHKGFRIDKTFTDWVDESIKLLEEVRIDEKVITPEMSIRLKQIPEYVDDIYYYTRLKDRLSAHKAGLLRAEDTSALLNKYKGLQEAIEKVEQTIGITADIEVKWAKENIKSYSLKFNATLRNMYLLQNEELTNLLEAVAKHDYASVPVLESLEAMSRYDVKGLRPLRAAISNFNEDPGTFKELYFDIMKETFDPAKQTAAFTSIDGESLVQMNLLQLSNTIDTILEVNESAKIMMDTFRGMVSVQQFYDSVQDAIDFGLDKDVASSFLDAIQRMYDSPATLVTLADLQENPRLLQLEFNKVMNNMEMQLRNKSLKYSSSLDNWKDWLFEKGNIPDDEIVKYEELFGTGSMSHTAPADAYSAYLVSKYVLEDHITPNVKNIYIDIEASGKGVSTSTTYQKSAVDPITGVYKWYINSGVTNQQLPEDDAIYHLLFGDNKLHNLDLDFLKDKFKKIYQVEDVTDPTQLAAAKQELIDFFGLQDSKIEIIMCKSEAELLAQSNAFVRSQKPPGGKLIMRMHNGLEYDVPLMNNRARYLGVEEFNITEYQVEDTKVLLEDLLGVRKLTLQERGTIEDLIYEHINRRTSELSALGNERMVGGVNRSLNENLSKFLPTMDRNFQSAYEKILKAFDPDVNQDIVKKAVGLPEILSGDYNSMISQFAEGDEFFGVITKTMRSFNEDLKDLGIIDKRMNRFKIFVDADDINATTRILPDDYAKGTPSQILANHVGMDLVTFNSRNGVYIPIIGTNRDVLKRLVVEFFDPGDRLVTEYAMKKMTAMAGNIQKTMSYIRNPHLIDSMDVDTLNELHKILLEELRKMAGNNYFSSVVGDLKLGTSPIKSFATTYELYKMYNNVANGTIAQVDIGEGIYRYPFIQGLYEQEKFQNIIGNMMNTKDLFKNVLSEYGEDAKYFTLEPHNADMEKIIEYTKRLAKGNMDSLRAIEEVQDLLQFARMKRVAPVYADMVESFDLFTDAVQKTEEHVAELMSKGKLKTAPANLKAAVYSNLRTMTDNYDAIISYNKLENVLSKTPEELATYLRHQGKGLITFKNNNLFSKNYFPKRGIGTVTDLLDRNMGVLYKNLVDSKDALEELGLGMHVTRRRTAVYIKDFSKVVDLKYVPITQDFEMGEWLELILANTLKDAGEVGEYMQDGAYQTIKDAILANHKARQKLTKLAVDGNTSTLELLDEIAMGRILSDLKVDIPDIVGMETLNKYGVFDGNFFNHSVLGHIDGRRELMNYAAFNPAKTMFNATDMIQKQLSTQVQMLQLIQTPEFMVDNILAKGVMSKDEMIEYLRKSRHLKVAFLNDKTGADGIQNFKLSSINVNSIKDIEFAEKMHAVIIDAQTYNTAYGAINNYRIRNSVINFMDKVFVATFKMGWLAFNYGVVARNIIDTSMKNIQSTKDLAIIPAMLDMTRDYFKFKSTLTEIYQYAQKQNIHIDVAVDEFFAKTPNTRISREMFDLITEYQKSGGEMGLVKEAMAYYGDSIDRMYKKIDQELSGLSKAEFREMMKLPDDVAEQWLKEKFPNDLNRVQMFLNTKGDLLTYKRAYEMHKAYKGSDISVDNFVTYLKSGRVQPGHEDIFKELLEKTKDVRIKEDAMTKLFNHPLIAASMSANMQSEEILRLALFKYLKDTGFNNTKAMAEVIRTHFDYTHKHIGQIYLEMAMPFSTFRILSLMYWVEEFSNNLGGVELLADGWEALSQFNDRSPEDVLLRRSLRYQMFTGNLVLNEETGLTAKINPSAMDMMSFFMSPRKYVEESFHSGAQAALELYDLKPYDNESEEDFYKRKQTLAYNMLPFFGSWINKIRQSWDKAIPTDDKNKKLDETADTGKFILNLILSPLFNTSWQPAQGGEWKRYSPYQKRLYMVSRPYYNKQRMPKYARYAKRYYPKKYYPKRYYGSNIKKIYPKKYRAGFKGYTNWSNYSTFNRMYYGAQFKFKRGSVYPTKSSRSLNTAFSDMWRLSMTKKGNAKYKFLAFPTNKWTLKLKVNILRNITSYNRWQ